MRQGPGLLISLRSLELLHQLLMLLHLLLPLLPNLELDSGVDITDVFLLLANGIVPGLLLLLEKLAQKALLLELLLGHRLPLEAALLLGAGVCVVSLSPAINVHLVAFAQPHDGLEQHALLFLQEHFGQPRLAQQRLED